MRHQRAGKKLGRDSAHRKALYANLAGALIEHGRIKTTEAKAKAVKPLAEQMITLGRRGDLAARRQAISTLRSRDVVHQLFADVAPRFVDRPGGYTRIVKLGPRQGDAAAHGLPRARGLRARRQRRRPDPAGVADAHPGGADRGARSGGERLDDARPASGRADRGHGGDRRPRDRRRRRLPRERRQLAARGLLLAGFGHVAERPRPAGGCEPRSGDGRERSAPRRRGLWRRAQPVRARGRSLADDPNARSACRRRRCRSARNRLRRRRRRRRWERPLDARVRLEHPALANASRPDERDSTLRSPRRAGGSTRSPGVRQGSTRTSYSSSRGRRARSAGGAKRPCRRRAAAPAPRSSVGGSFPSAARRPEGRSGASTRTTP